MFVWLSGSETTPPILLKFRSSKTFIIVTVATAIFTDIFVYGIIVPVLPFALVSRADINPNQVQKWISIFLAVYGAALLTAAPVFGWLADRSKSRYWPLLLGLLALGGATVMLCVGNSIVVFTIGRILQGASAAVVWVVGLALLVDTVGPDEIGQAMGYVGLSMSLALLVAPLLGGVVYASAGYYAVFAMAFGLMALDVFLRVIMIEKKVAVRWTTPEFTEEQKKKAEEEEQNRDSVVSIEMDVVGMREGPARPAIRDSAHQPFKRADLSTQSAVDEVPLESTPPVMKRWSQKLPPVIFLLSSRRLLSALWASIIQASLYTAFDTILPLFVRDTFHWNSTGAGLIFLPIVILSFFGPVVGWLTDKYGPRLFATAGYVLGCPSIILLRLVHKETMDQKVLLCALLAMVGFSLALVVTPTMAEITYAVEAKSRNRAPGHFGKNGAYAQAYSLFNVAWAAGCMIGPLLAGLVNQANGWATATLILGVISIFTAIPVAIWTGGSIFKKRKARGEGRTGQENNATA